MVIANVYKYKDRIKRFKTQDVRKGKVHPTGKFLGFQVIHSNKKDELGKPIKATPKPTTYKKALSIHRAIEVNKRRR